MNAQEAKEIATQFITTESDGEVGRVLTKVKQIADKGGFSLQVKTLHPLAQKKLKELGYQVSHYSDQRDNESHHTISWA